VIVLILAAAWCSALVGLLIAAAFLGRPPRQDAAAQDRVEAYETGRMSDRLRHFNQVRREELSQLRRGAA
jgi:hypothetical protein